MLKFETVANVGEKIRAFDFEPMPDRPDSFVTGVIVEKGPIFSKFEANGPEYYICDGYTIECEFDTDERRVGEKIFVPFEMSLSDFDTRVEIV